MGMKRACSRTMFDLINWKIMTKMGPFLGILCFLSWLFSGESTSTLLFVFTRSSLWVIQRTENVWSGTISRLLEPHELLFMLQHGSNEFFYCLAFWQQAVPMDSRQRILLDPQVFLHSTRGMCLWPTVGDFITSTLFLGVILYQTKI